MPSWRELITASGLPAAEAQLLAAHVAGRTRSWLLAHDDEAAPAGMLDAAYARRRNGEPIAYITGEREFYSLSFAVTPDVLIPRPETELLVNFAIGRVPQQARVLDIGTGSGAIAIAFGLARPDAQVCACDLSPAALAVARGNAGRLGARVDFRQSDAFAAYAGGRFDAILSNPPYIAEGDAHLAQGDLRFEPRLALASGADGLLLIRRMAQDARAHLAAGGWLIFEHGHDQGRTCTQLLESLGYTQVCDLPDYAGIPRLCAGQWTMGQGPMNAPPVSPPI